MLSLFRELVTGLSMVMVECLVTTLDRWVPHGWEMIEEVKRCL